MMLIIMAMMFGAGCRRHSWAKMWLWIGGIFGVSVFFGVLRLIADGYPFDFFLYNTDWLRIAPLAAAQLVVYTGSFALGRGARALSERRGWLTVTPDV